jgi:hypothetical protein
MAFHGSPFKAEIVNGRYILLHLNESLVSKAKDNIHLQMVKPTSEISRTVNLKALEQFITPMEINMKLNGRMVK